MDKTKKKALDNNDLYRDKPKNPNKKFHVSLPVPPSVNHMYFNTRGGGKSLNGKGKKFMAETRAILNEVIREQKWHMPTKYTWLYMDCVFYFSDRRIRDSHNCLKILIDALQGYVFKDDYTVLPRIQSVEYDKDNPRVDVYIKPQTEIYREKGLHRTNN